MKFHKIKIENITSLAGINVIDFDKLLSDEQIFAITGATGSGKSSILSAISLALYGDSHKKSLNNDDFVTLGATYGKVILDFSMGMEQFQSCWECRIAKKNGELLKMPKIQRSLSQGGRLLDKNAAEIIGLTFEQFCKTVVLNQGEFSKFISSNFSKRRDILERLYGNKTLAQLSKHLGTKIKNVEIQISNLNAKLDTALPYQSEEIDIFRKELLHNQKLLAQELKTQSPSLELQKNFKDLLDLFAQHKQNSSKYTETQSQLALAIEEFNQAKKEQQKITFDLQQKEAIFQEQSPKLQEAISIEKEIMLSRQYYNELESQIDKNQKDLEQSKKSLKKITEEIDLIRNQKKELEQGNQSLAQLSAEDINHLSQIIRSGIEIINHHKLMDQNIDNIKNKLKNDHDKVKSLNREVLELNKKFNPKVHKQYQDEKETLHKKLGQHHSKIAILGQINATIEKEEEKKRQLSIEKEQIQIEISKSELEHEKILNRLRNTKFEIEKLDFEHAKQKCLAESIKQHQCVICGSTLDSTLHSTTPPFKTVDQLRDEERTVYENQHKIEKNISNLVEKNKHLDQQQNITKQTLEKAHEDITKLFPNVNRPQEAKQEGEQLQEKLNAVEQKIKSCIGADAQLKNLTKQIDDLNSNIVISKELLNKNDLLRQKYLKEINTILNKVVTICPHYPKDLEAIPPHFYAEEKKWHQINQLQNKQRSLLQQQEMLVQSMKAAQNQINDTSAKIKEKNNEIKKLQTQKIALCPEGSPPEILKQLTNELQSLKIKKESAQEKNHHKERTKERLNATLDTLSERKSDIEHTLITTTNKCKEKSQLLNNLLKDNNLESPVTNALSKVSEIDYQSDVTEKEIELNYFYDTILCPFCEQNQATISNIKEAISQFEIKIQMYDSKIQDQQQALKELEQINHELHILKDLQDLIGNNEFRNYILGLIEKQIIQYANKELSSLCDGRYEIFQQEKRSAQEFYIIDHWKSGLPRKISTLSGGETFLISLAMALSLADMTRGQTEIDSFYIDEGFGSLDSESIDEALDILSKVRSRGKQIGIISHVTSLTDRIPINITLTKSQFGESTIRINN